MKKAGSRILIITFGIMAAIAILYPWKFVPEYGILQMTESGEKAGKTAESQESDEEYMQVADRAVEALFTGDTDTLLSLLPERYFGQYGETLQWIIENAVEEELQKLQDEVGDIQITHWPVRSEKQSEGNMEKIKSHYGEEGDTVTDARNVFVEVSASGIEPEEMEIAVVEIDGKWYLDFEGWDDGSEENYDDEDDDEEDDDDDDTWSDDEDDISSNAETSHTLENMKFSDAREFQDGLAFVRIHGKGESYKGFLDKKGKLKFYIPFDEDAIDADIYRYDVNFNNGYNWFVYDNIFYVIDTDGMIKSQYDADKVADYGGGYTWLEEEENVSWDDAGFWKYTLYSPEGGEVCDYTVSNQDLENLSFKRSYMGDGKFLYKKMDGTKEVCVLVEPELGKETELNVSFDKAEEHGMRDGLIIETGAMDDGYWAGDENPFHITVIGNGEEKEIEIPSQYLGPFGGYPTLLDWTKKYALFTVRQDDQDIYFLCDLETGDIKKYTGKYAPYFKYYSTTTSCIEDNVLALSMYGEDNQFYVCLINADTMKEIADPIAGESFSMEDKTLLIDQKELYDLSGNLLYTVEDGKKGELVSDGILQVTYSEEEKETVDGESEYVEVDKTDYYDLKGKKLFSEMDTADSKMVPEPSEEV